MTHFGRSARKSPPLLLLLLIPRHPSGPPAVITRGGVRLCIRARTRAETGRKRKKQDRERKSTAKKTKKKASVKKSRWTPAKREKGWPRKWGRARVPKAHRIDGGERERGGGRGAGQPAGRLGSMFSDSRESLFKTPLQPARPASLLFSRVLHA